VELLRIEYYPYHYQFKMRYIHRELPPDVAEHLQQLFFVRDEADLKRKYKIATGWVEEILSKRIGPRP
jgi:hypothetical protein